MAVIHAISGRILCWIGRQDSFADSTRFYHGRWIMWEKIGAFFVMVIAIPMMAFIKGLELPALVTIPLVLACTVFYLIAVVFLFSEGTVIKWPQRTEATFREPLKAPSIENL